MASNHFLDHMRAIGAVEYESELRNADIMDVIYKILNTNRCDFKANNVHHILVSADIFANIRQHIRYTVNTPHITDNRNQTSLYGIPVSSVVGMDESCICTISLSNEFRQYNLRENIDDQLIKRYNSPNFKMQSSDRTRRYTTLTINQAFEYCRELYDDELIKSITFFQEQPELIFRFSIEVDGKKITILEIETDDDQHDSIISMPDEYINHFDHSREELDEFILRCIKLKKEESENGQDSKAFLRYG